jgi:PGF-pre-PGF domain-containing protein
VNVGGDSAISRVTVTGQGIADIIVTARKLASLPSGVIPMDKPVYQYIDVVPARYTVISAALIEFDVPLFSIADHDASMNTVSLCVLNNRTWICLPTYKSGSKNGRVLYHAESPEFSLFAITIQNGTCIAPHESVPTISPVSGKSTGYASRESNISAIPEIPVKITPGGPDTGFSFMPLVISIMGMIGIVLGVVLIRSWWVR